MAVFRIEKTRDYTVMSNHHLKDRTLTLKSKGLLSMMLSLPDEWNYTTRGLAAICREGVDSIGAALKELETHGYIRRTQLRDEKGKITDTEYVIYEMPQCEPPSSPGTPLPGTAKPYTWTLQAQTVLHIQQAAERRQFFFFRMSFSCITNHRFKCNYLYSML